MTPEEKAERERRQIARLREQCRKIRHYFNTNRETGDELKASELKAKSESEQVYTFFLRSGKPHAVFHVIQAFFPGHIIDLHIRSMSRAISNLKTAGILEKTDIRILGHKGKKVHLYRLPPEWTLEAELPKKPKQMELFNASHNDYVPGRSKPPY